MTCGKERIDMEIKAKNEVLENANEFVYLGSVLTRDNDHQGHQGKNRKVQGSYGRTKFIPSRISRKNFKRPN